MKQKTQKTSDQNSKNEVKTECPACGSSNLSTQTQNGVTIYICNSCNQEFD